MQRIWQLVIKPASANIVGKIVIISGVIAMPLLAISARIQIEIAGRTTITAYDSTCTLVNCSATGTSVGTRVSIGDAPYTLSYTIDDGLGNLVCNGTNASNTTYAQGFCNLRQSNAVPRGFISAALKINGRTHVFSDITSTYSATAPCTSNSYASRGSLHTGTDPYAFTTIAMNAGCNGDEVDFGYGPRGLIPPYSLDPHFTAAFNVTSTGIYGTQCATARFENFRFGSIFATLDCDTIRSSVVSAGASDASATGPDCAPCQGIDQSARAGGVTTWSAELLVAGLQLRDTPVGYKPPVGPSVNFQLFYSHRDNLQPSSFNYSNLGSKWTHTWISYITDSVSSSSTATVYNRGGGAEEIAFASPAATISQISPYSQTQLVRTTNGSATTGFTRTIRDGSREEFNTAISGKFFLSAIVDKSGNRVALGYDAQNRLRTITDALGKVTTLSYELSSDALKITKVTDPFGRSASFSYNSAGRLASVTDVIGVSSSFIYNGDFVSSLTTPYGTTTFSFGDSSTDSSLGTTRYLVASDPLGNKTRVEFNDGAAIAASESAAPAGMTVANNALNRRNTFIWSPAQYAAATAGGGLDYTKAKVIHWLTMHDGQTASRVPESIKEPLEGRVWFSYAGQASATSLGSTSRPTVIGRVLDDGSSQLYRYSYNGVGNVLESTDPLGRKLTHAYATNGIDRTSSTNTTGGTAEVLAVMTYDSQHNIKTLTGANGKTALWDYNAAGQPTKATDQLGRATTFTYDSGYLSRIDGPLGAKLVMTYDAAGRVQTRTNSIGTKLVYGYDDADRVTTITYPDGTSIVTGYTRLDLTSVKNRMGRTRTITPDALRRVTQTQDALNRVVKYGYAPGGQLNSLTDENGHQTLFAIDIQGRTTGKTYADGTTHTYNYEPATSRLKRITDAKAQTTTFTYNLDDTLVSKVYGNAVVATAPVAYTYDSRYRRPSSMVDGNGTTTYSYHGVSAAGTLGGNQLKSVTSPIPGSTTLTDTIVYSYDALGRVVGRNVDGSTETTEFDELGRIKAVNNDLANFQYGYLDATPRVTSITPSSGPSVALTYYDGQRDELLKSMAYTSPTGASLSKYGYEYDANGNVTRFDESYPGQQFVTAAAAASDADAPLPSIAATHAYAQADKAALLTLAAIAVLLLAKLISRSARRRIWPALPVAASLALASCGGGGDGSTTPSGGSGGGGTTNPPTTQQPTTAITRYGYDAVDRLTSAAEGTDVAEPTGDPKYKYTYDNASNLLTIKRGASLVSYTYSSTNGVSSSNYDANGNTTSQNGWTYTWDAADRLVKAVSGSVESNFLYDGASRIVRVVDKSNAIIIKDKSLLWCGSMRCAERDNLQGNSATIKNFFNQGEISPSTKLFYGVDRLGSVRQSIGTTGSIVSQFTFDPYGQRSTVSSHEDVDTGFTMLLRHGGTGFYFALFRAYDAESMRWINRDPIRESGGLNLYNYVDNKPLSKRDPSGLDAGDTVMTTFGLPNASGYPAPQTPPISLAPSAYELNLASQFANNLSMYASAASRIAAELPGGQLPAGYLAGLGICAAIGAQALRPEPQQLLQDLTMDAIAERAGLGFYSEPLKAFSDIFFAPLAIRPAY